MRFAIVKIAAIAVMFASQNAFAYSYAEAEDPMVELFKQGVAAAKKGQWNNVASLAQQGAAKQKGHLFDADALAPQFDKAIGAKDISRTGELFANLVYLSIREKLHRIKKEGVKNYKNDKSRLSLARKSYLDVLDGNVKKQDPKASKAVQAQFNAALTALGNPGLFGVGGKPSDPASFAKAVSSIEKSIAKMFPGFAGD